MPLLKREPDLFPSDLFSLSCAEVPWWVAHVRSRQEKVFARHLHQRGIAFYLPQREERSRRNGRNFVSHLPLFPGYVFVRGDERLSAMRSGVVAGMIDVADQTSLDDELRQIHELQLSGALLTPYADLAPGDVVRVTDGVFKGRLGVVVREKGKLRLVVSVSIVNSLVAVEFDRDALAVDRRAALSDHAA